MKDDQKFVLQFFDSLRMKNIAYCVLRNVSEIISGDVHDIDMTVDFEKINEVLKILNKIARQQGWKLHFIAEKDNGNLLTYHYFKIVHDIPIIVHFDFFKYFSWSGYRLLDNKILLSNRIVTGSIAEASPPIKAITMLFSRLLYHGYIKEKYRSDILNIFLNDKDKVVCVMNTFLGIELSEYIYENVISEKWDMIESKYKEIRKQITGVLGKKQKLLMLRKLMFSIKRISKHTGMVMQLSNFEKNKIDDICGYLSRTFPEESIIKNKNIGIVSHNLIKTNIDLSRGFLIFTNKSNCISKNDIVVVDSDFTEQKIACEILIKMSRRYNLCSER